MINKEQRKLLKKASLNLKKYLENKDEEKNKKLKQALEESIDELCYFLELVR